MLRGRVDVMEIGSSVDDSLRTKDTEASMAGFPLDGLPNHDDATAAKNKNVLRHLPL